MPEELSDLAAMRVSYAGGEDLDVHMLDDGWLALAQKWLSDAISAELPEPNAIVLGTVDAKGFPATRTVLCKGLSSDGVVFYTNFGSAKGLHLAGTPYASATFPWIGIQRQMTVRGTVEHVDAATTEEYFHSRPRGSQLGAWASAQSHPIESRAALEAALDEVTNRFDGVDVPVPDNWGGFRIRPDTVEFWQGRNSRLHNRIRVTLGAAGVTDVERLQP